MADTPSRVSVDHGTGSLWRWDNPAANLAVDQAHGPGRGMLGARGGRALNLPLAFGAAHPGSEEPARASSGLAVDAKVPRLIHLLGRRQGRLNNDLQLSNIR